MACLHLDRSNAAVLAVAGAVSRRFDAMVVGVAARQASINVSARGLGPGEPHEHDTQKFREWAGSTEEEFRTALSDVPSLAWRAQLTFGPATDYVADEARAVDLVVASTEPRDRFLLPTGCPEPGDLIMRLGRPILAVPPAARGFGFGGALICWQDLREASRAVLDAIT